MANEGAGGLLGALASGLLLLVVFGCGNVLCVGWQLVETADDRAMLRELELDLAQREERINGLERQLQARETTFEAGSGAVEQCTKKVAAFEAQAVGGELAPDVYADYSTALENCNEQIAALNRLASTIRVEFASYEKEVDDYNVVVARHNDAAARVGSLEVLIPIPVGRAGRAVR